MRIKISIFGGVLHIFFKVLNGVRKRVAMENKSLELEQYSVSKPRNDNIVKHYGDSDHGKNKAVLLLPSEIFRFLRLVKEYLRLRISVYSSCTWTNFRMFSDWNENNRNIPDVTTAREKYTL
jgi:hypothetical protein